MDGRIIAMIGGNSRLLQCNSEGWGGESIREGPPGRDGAFKGGSLESQKSLVCRGVQRTVWSLLLCP